MYAMRGDDYVPVRFYQKQFMETGQKIYPKDLTCPECDLPMTMKYPKVAGVQTIIPHYAHAVSGDGADRCALNNRESADHFNAKIRLSRYMGKALKDGRGFGIVYRCNRCRNQNTCLEILDYDRAIPERKTGTRRPDISCFAGNNPVGAAEIYHTHAVDEEKKKDLAALSIGWFEIPASGYKDWDRSILPFNSKEGYTITCIDASRIAVMNPAIPQVCPMCEEQMRREAIARAKAKEEVERRRVEEARRQEEERLLRLQEQMGRAAQRDAEEVERIRAEIERREKARAQREAEEQARRAEYERKQEERRATEEARAAADFKRREEERLEAERIQAEYLAKKAEFEELLRAADGAIKIPLDAPIEYRWWHPLGQSIYRTLIQFNANLDSWKRYGASNKELLTDQHGRWCDCAPIAQDGFTACECGYYAVHAQPEPTPANPSQPR